MRWHASARTVGGLAAVAGGVMWGVKSLSILAFDDQPPLVFEAAVPLFGLTVALLASDGRRSRGGRAAQALGVLACVSGSVAVVTELVDQVWGPAIATAMVAVIVGLVLVGVTAPRASRHLRATGGVALAIALATLPALIIGGLLAMVDERLLEVPLLILGCMWTWLGAVMLRSRDAAIGRGRGRSSR